MKIVEVTTPEQVKEFNMFPVRLHKELENWIRPLNKDLNQIFDKEKNKAFRKGECIRWILQDPSGQTIGRIAAFIDWKRANKGNDQPTGGVGFFECINNKEAAHLLFDKGKSWLEEKGMEAMDGPINFGERDKWWGLLTDGFDLEPNYCMPYNPEYYQELFESYGFQVYFKQYTYGRKIFGKKEDNEVVTERIYEKANRVINDPDYSFRHLKKSELDKYTEDFLTIYNEAWGGHKGVPAMDIRQARSIMKQLKPIMDERVIWFAYFKERPIGFFVNLPELNQSFKYLNGQFNLMRKVQFIWNHKFRKKNKKLLGLVFGVVPDFQRKGIDGALVTSFREMVQQRHKRYEYFEMNWIGDFNPKMMVVAEQVGGHIVKTHHTYRKLFDDSKPFKRMPIIK